MVLTVKYFVYEGSWSLFLLRVNAYTENVAKRWVALCAKPNPPAFRITGPGFRWESPALLSAASGPAWPLDAYTAGPRIPAPIRFEAKKDGGRFLFQKGHGARNVNTIGNRQPCVNDKQKPPIESRATLLGIITQRE